jgi:cytochrome c oxidase assembly protein Cox11
MAGYIGQEPANKFLTLDKQTFTTSATDTYSLDRSVSSANDIELFLNNVRQEPIEAYTVNGSTLTLASAITSSDTMYCIYQGKAIGTVSPATNSVSNSMLVNSSINLNGSDVSLGGSATVGGNNTPAFSAYLNSGQSIPSSTVTTIAFDVENFDSDGCYSTSTYRFTPTEAGKYLIFANTRITNTGNNTSDLNLEIRHSVQNSILRISGGSQTQTTWSGSVIATMNGTSDYVYASFYHNDGGAQTLDPGNGDTLFGGFKLIGA